MFIKYPQEFEFLFNFALLLIGLDFIYLYSIKFPSLSNTISDRLLLLKHPRISEKIMKITANIGGTLNHFPACCFQRLHCYAYLLT